MQARSRQGGAFLLIFGAATAVIGVLITISGAFPFSWRTTEGQLLEASVETRGEPGRPTYRPGVKFRYTVGGETYQGVQYDPNGWEWRTRPPVVRRVEALLRTQEAEGRVVVYYPPDAPERGVVAFLFITPALSAFAFGLVFMFFGISMVSRSLRAQMLSSALGLASFLGIFAGVGAAFFISSDLDTNPWPGVAWGACLAAFAFLTMRDPAFKHAAEMEERFSPEASSGEDGRMEEAGADPEVDLRGKRLGLALGGAGLFVVLLAAGFMAFSAPFRSAGTVAVTLCLGLVVGLVVALSAHFAVRNAFRVWSEVRSLQMGWEAACQAFARRTRGLLGAGTAWSKGSPRRLLCRSVSFSHQRSQAQLAYLKIREDGKSARETGLTRLRMALPRSLPLRCNIAPQWTTLPFRAILGLQDIQLGCELFDDQFVVKGNDEEAVRAVLTRPVQEDLLALLHLSRTPSDERLTFTSGVRLSVNPGELRIEVGAFLGTEEELLRLYHTGAKVHAGVKKGLGP